MSMTVTPFPMDLPPRVLIELSTGSAAVFGSIKLYRDGVPVRTQPNAGGSTASAVDYFMPVQKETTYRAVTDQGVFTDTIVLAAEDGLMIHASQPSWTLPLSKNRNNSICIKAIGGVSNSSSATLHRPIGSSVSVSKRTGPRPKGQRTLTLQSFTAEQAAQLDTILADDTPIMFRVPGWWQIRFSDGWYQITSYEEQNPFDTPGIGYAGKDYREWALTLEPVAEPKLVVHEVWSWATLRDSGTTWGTLPLTWSTWPDVRIDSRR